MNEPSDILLVAHTRFGSADLDGLEAIRSDSDADDSDAEDSDEEESGGSDPASPTPGSPAIPAHEIERVLRDRGHRVQRWSLPDPAPDRSFDRVLVLGGDGFMMSVIHRLGYPTTPFFGINYGRVGFLMNAPMPPEALVDQLESPELREATYPILEALLVKEDGQEVRRRAFNDVVIERASGQTAQLDLYIDDVLLNSYSGDGLIVATPGGSTAYSLAAGGPVVHHSVDSMLVTPLCPHRPVQFHSLPFPLVLSLGSKVRIANLDSKKRPLRCVFDGRSVEGVREISISHEGSRVKLLRSSEYEFIDTLVRKVIGRRIMGEEGGRR